MGIWHINKNIDTAFTQCVFKNIYYKYTYFYYENIRKIWYYALSDHLDMEIIFYKNLITVKNNVSSSSHVEASLMKSLFFKLHICVHMCFHNFISTSLPQMSHVWLALQIGKLVSNLPHNTIRHNFSLVSMGLPYKTAMTTVKTNCYGLPC